MHVEYLAYYLAVALGIEFESGEHEMHLFCDQGFTLLLTPSLPR